MFCDNVVSPTAHTCLPTEYFLICLQDIRIYLEPEVAFSCKVTGQSKAQLSILKSTELVYLRPSFSVISGKLDV